MSTIEKAAAKLVAKRAAKSKQIANDAEQVTQETVQPTPTSQRPGTADMLAARLGVGKFLGVDKRPLENSEPDEAPLHDNKLDDDQIVDSEVEEITLKDYMVEGNWVVENTLKDEEPEKPEAKMQLVHEDDGNKIDDLVTPRSLSYTCELDFAWLAENGFLVPGHSDEQHALEFRRIKRPLLLNTQRVKAEREKYPANLILVTSSLPAEGKTFVALNLALSLAAEVDRTVLLIDGDVATGDLSRWMGIYEEPGLADLLVAGKRNTDGLVFETNVDRLEVLPCGRLTENLDELFASEFMDDFMGSLARQSTQRILVVDGPPLLATTEASVLAHHMGQIVMVVEVNKTPQVAAQQAVDQIKDCKNVSVLLNKVTRSEATTRYGYGNGYSYRYRRRKIGNSGPTSSDPGAIPTDDLNQTVPAEEVVTSKLETRT